MTRRQALALYKKREIELKGIVSAIHPYEAVEGKKEFMGKMVPCFHIFDYEDTILSDFLCEEESEAYLRNCMNNFVKELNINFYMLYGDEKLRSALED